MARLSRFLASRSTSAEVPWLRALATAAARAGRRARAPHEQVRDPQHEHHGVGGGPVRQLCLHVLPQEPPHLHLARDGAGGLDEVPAPAPARSRCTGCPASPRVQRRFQNPSPRATWRTVPAGSAAVISPRCVASTHGAPPRSISARSRSSARRTVATAAPPTVTVPVRPCQLSSACTMPVCTSASEPDGTEIASSAFVTEG